MSCTVLLGRYNAHMFDRDDHIYAECHWQLIEGPFTFRQPKWYHSLKKRATALRRLLVRPAGRMRERIVEMPLVIAAMSRVPAGRVADLGGASSTLAAQLVYLGHQVHVLDLRCYPLQHPNLSAQTIDIFDCELPDDYFDAISCISVIEHVGITRYGGQVIPDGDFKLIAELNRLCRPGGSVMLSAPYGRGHDPASDGAPHGYRIYDRERLARLLEHSDVQSLRFFVMQEGCWVEQGQQAADDVRTSRPISAIFFAELRPKK